MLLVVTRKQHLSEFPWYNSSIFVIFFPQRSTWKLQLVLK